MSIRLSAFVAIAAAAVFVVTLLRAVVFAPDGELLPFNRVVPVEAGAPARLEIPRLGIDANVQLVGVNAKGNMASPSNFSDVSWYMNGTSPGSLGSAVMAGHVDNGLGLPGVFKELHTLRKGDELYVVTEEGKRLRFVVEEVRMFAHTAVPPDLLFTRADTVRLNLVTCDGAWLESEKTYDKRLVVFAVLA